MRSAPVVCGWLTLGLLIMAAAFAPELRGQGRLPQRQRSASAAVTATRAAAERTRLESGRRLLGRLVGIWHYEIWFAGNLDGAPDASGSRTVKPLFDDLRLEWTEELDHSSLVARGVIGFDPTSGRFFSTAEYSGEAAPDVMTGVLDNAEPLVTFQEVAVAPDSSTTQPAVQTFVLNMVDEDHFTLVPLDRAWRSVFTRQEERAPVVSRSIAPIPVACVETTVAARQSSEPGDAQLSTGEPGNARTGTGCPEN